jgi:ADP-heptose:LPS heptosyltransferase
LSGAPQRIGFAGPESREFSRWLHTARVRPTTTHVIDRNLELLRAVGIHRPCVTFELPAYEQEAETMHAFLQRERLHSFAVINPGAGWPSKRWEMDRFAAVAAHLGKVHQLPSVVAWAGAEERGWAEQIVAGADNQAVLAPNTTLRELATLLRSASLFVGSDTGPLHLAAAVGTPCVALFGPVAAQRNGPYGTGHVALQRVLLNGPSRMRRSADNQAMCAISVADVVQACDRLLQRERPARRSA